MAKENESEPPRVIVLDTAAFIAGSESLFALGGLVDTTTDTGLKPISPAEKVVFFTTPDVIQEVRDSKARSRLSLLQDSLVVRAPSSEALATVISFARATGDYSVLSPTDLRVMSLCWMLEFERNGMCHLRTEPMKLSSSQIRIGTLIPAEEIDRVERERQKEIDAERIANDGWTVVGKSRAPQVPSAVSVTSRPRRRRRADSKQPHSTSVSQSPSGVNEQQHPNRLTVSSSNDGELPQLYSLSLGENSSDVEPSLLPQVALDGANLKSSLIEGEKSERNAHHQATGESDTNSAIFNNDKKSTIVSSHMQTKAVVSASSKVETELALDGNHKAIKDSPKEGSENKRENVCSDVIEDDGVGWINPDNLNHFLARDALEEVQTFEDEMRIGCVTTDFAMQNTMLQMGLKVLTVDGRRAIRSIKHFVLRCHACNTVTRDLEKKFCDSCGNFAMHRVAFRVGKDGVARAFLNPKKGPYLRGTKYPLPMPRGGRHNNDLILCADQIDPVQQKRIEKRLLRTNVDVLDPSTTYNADVNFRPHDRPLVIGYGRRNPNEVRRTRRKKR